MQTFFRFIFLIPLLSIIIPVFCNAQNFEGEIVFIKETKQDTTYYAYKIKGNKLRIEELDQKLQLINYMLVDISAKSVIALNTKRKLYVEIPVRSIESNNDTSIYKVIKTDNYKSIKGFKCYQWRVQNKKEDTEIAFWVSNQNFHNFSDFLKLLNRDEKSSVYYLQIPDSQEFFPLLSEERSLLREWRMCLKVVNIEKKHLSPSLFEIPQGYKLFQKN